MPQLAPYLFGLLYREGVEHAFGIPGDFALTLFDALAESKIDPIVMTHEPCVGFAADAYARIRGLGLAVVTYSVGGLNMLNAVAGAYAEKSPLVVLSGGPGVRERMERDLLHHKVKTFETQRRIYEEVTSYAAILNNPATASTQIHRALDYALNFKRPVYLEIPRDMVYADIDVQEPAPRFSPPTTDVETLAEAVAETLDLLSHAKAPVILAGVEVHRFGLNTEVLALAEQLGAPICTTMLGKSAISESHPHCIGTYNGEVGNPYIRNLVEESDCLLMLGAFMTDINLGLFTAHLKPSCTIDATSEHLVIKRHEYPHVQLKDYLMALTHHESLPKHDSSFMVPISRAHPSKHQMTMSGVLYELNQFIDGDTILIADSGDALFCADDLHMPSASSFLGPAYYASMGFGVPAVIGAQLADPFRRAIALVGDGAFQMTGMELLTAHKLGLRPIILVVNNGNFASLRMMGHQQADFVAIPNLDYAQFAALMGGEGYVVETSHQLSQALHAAKAAETFSLLEIRLSSDDVSPALQQLGALFAKTLKG